MLYATIIIILAAAMFFVACSAKSKNLLINDNPNEIKVTEQIVFVTDTIKPMYSKHQIEEKLEILTKTPPPEDLAFGAMCYSPVSPNESNFDYICPTCGEKTIYKSNRSNGYRYYNEEYQIAAARSEAKRISGLNIKLDESQYCSHCRQIEVDDPCLCLLVNIAGESDTTKVCHISQYDIELINYFLNGDLKYKGGNDAEYPLVDRMERIEELLGVSIKK
jgi:predicted RNA-binding Zn-ribbon protein involved in translation (DUF1610 family)